MLSNYTPLDGAYDELFDSGRAPRAAVADVVNHLSSIASSDFRSRQRLANGAFLHGGVTFSVYSNKDEGVEKIFPFDLIPRVIFPTEWEQVQKGIQQRVLALNHFLRDVYGDQRILKEGHIPKALVLESPGYLPKLHGIRPPGDVYVHIAGVDLIRGPDGGFVVLEDNLRCPSGVSYVLENRRVMKRVFPTLFERARVRSVGEYPRRLRSALLSLARRDQDPRLVVLTPGSFNSAYFEHSFLARTMACELVEGPDLFVDDDRVFVKTTSGPEPVDVIYRRIDDEFLDPGFFRPDSLLGVRGIMQAYAKGQVVLANAPGNGVADDKAIYPFVPEMIRFYLSEEPILAQVPTYICAVEDDRKKVLGDIEQMVVKAVDGSGGYGMLFGPRASKDERDEFCKRIRATPRDYIAQPLIELSTCPTWTEDGAAPRRVDLRPFALTGDRSWVLPGGLTRVALAEGSYVVNSSQGGGSKDTWVLEPR